MESLMDRLPLRQLSHATTLVVGLVFAAWAFSFGIGTFSRPGPGMWPFAGATIMVLGSLYLILRERSDADYEKFTLSARNVLIALALLAISAIAFNLLGLTIAAALLLLSWMLILGKESFKVALLVTIGSVVVIYFVFGQFLGIPFPPDVVLDSIGI